MPKLFSSDLQNEDKMRKSILGLALLTAFALTLGSCSSTQSLLDKAEKGSKQEQIQVQSEGPALANQASEIRWATTAKAPDSQYLSAIFVRI